MCNFVAAVVLWAIVLPALACSMACKCPMLNHPVACMRSHHAMWRPYNCLSSTWWWACRCPVPTPVPLVSTALVSPARPSVLPARGLPSTCHFSTPHAPCCCPSAVAWRWHRPPLLVLLHGKCRVVLNPAEQCRTLHFNDLAECCQVERCSSRA